jgi:Cof subfamily protein (haloacid dehalogenase superfamily)
MILHNNSALQGKNIRLVVTDIDGTIAGESNQVSQRVRAAIKGLQAKGIQVAIATGRMYKSALRFHQDIGADLPIIAYQGAWIQDAKTQKVHRHLAVSKDCALELLDHFEQPELRSILSVHFYVNDKLYVREITDLSKAYGERTQVTPHPVGDLRNLLSDHQPTKVLALCDDSELIENLLQTLKPKFVNQLYLTKSVATFFEATHPQVNKGTAVKFLAEEILGLKPENVMTIGDNFNDVEMLEYAGLGVAMGNAPAKVKEFGDWIAPSVEEDGAAVAIEKFLLCS